MALSKHRRKPGEIATRRMAIRNFCYECVGYQISEAHKCTSKECWLYPYRPGSSKKEFDEERKTAGLIPLKRKVKTKYGKESRKEEVKQEPAV
jgi:hypothetical protein